MSIWQWRSNNSQQANSKRTLLLQSILDAKSTNYINFHELLVYLRKHENQMDDNLKKNIEDLLPRMRHDHNNLEKLHDYWSNYADGKSLSEIEQELSIVNVIASEASDTSKIIEKWTQI